MQILMHNLLFKFELDWSESCVVITCCLYGWCGAVVSGNLLLWLFSFPWGVDS